MKLFLILYAGTQIGGVAGPLPYDKPECEARANALRYDLATVIFSGRSTDGTDHVVDQPTISKMKTWRFACEFREKPPQITKE